MARSTINEPVTRQSRSIDAVTALNIPVSRASGTQLPVKYGAWLVGPWFDLLIFANMLWPVWLLVMAMGDGFAGTEGLRFWQVYFVTTPHRWITLAVVFLDRERLNRQRGLFFGAAAVVVVTCAGVQWTTGKLTCLLAIDYVWNAWHFAAQHHGVYRIYDRMADSARTAGLRIEKFLFRAFLLYVTVRLAAGTWSSSFADIWLERADWLLAAVPAGLVLRDLTRWREQAWGRLAYLISVSTLYLSLLAAVHAQKPALALMLTTASALFHATEYLGLIGWMVHRRHCERGDALGMLGWLAPRWVAVLILFAIVLGASGWMIEHQFLQAWLFINVIAAFLHYIYDGMIWRRPRASARRDAAIVAAAVV
ncbi:MAG: hypothetical protein Q8K78_02515 [Planctomycetaceae bacterium]|nr:hypothetical protein [Planctomycetaceae bacterium]